MYICIALIRDNFVYYTYVLCVFEPEKQGFRIFC